MATTTFATTTLADIVSTTVSSSATATCTTAVPGKYGHVPADSCNANYAYDPSFGGNLAFAVLFGLTTLVHLIEAIALKKRFCWVIIMGGLWETGAFIIKTIGSHNQQQLQYALWGTLLFLLAPLWINAFVYMTVARMIYFSLPEKKIWGIRAIRLTVIFIWLDICCFLIQGVGGSLMSNDGDEKLTRIGQKVYMAGIGVQMAFIIIFAVMTCWFYYKLVQLEGRNIGRVRYLIWTMLGVLVLVTMRIIFRLVEFGPGVNVDNPILTNEAYALGLDALPMVLALVMMNVVHPGFVLRGPDSEFPRLSRKEKKRLKQQKEDENERQRRARQRAKRAKRAKQGRYELDERSTQEEYRQVSSEQTSRRGMMV